MKKKSELSRRTLIKGSVTTAFAATTTRLSACAPDPRKAQASTTQADYAAIPALAVWLLLTVRQDFSDYKPQNETDTGKLAKKIVSDMGLTGDTASMESKIKNFVDSIRSNAPIPTVSKKGDLYDLVKKDLDTIMTVVYGQPQCPKTYATLTSMANGKCS